MARKKLVGSAVDQPAEPEADHEPCADETAGLPDSEIDREVLARALRKKQKGEQLTQLEQRVFKSMERKRDQAARERLYQAIPKADYVRLSGRQAKVLNEQADRYGLPLRGKAIDLGRLLTAFHNFIAENSSRLAPAADDLDPLMQGPITEGLERLRHLNADIAEHKLQIMRSEVVPIDEVRGGLVAMFERLRSVGESLQRDFGAGAHALMDEALSGIELDLVRMFGGDNGCIDSEQPDDDGGEADPDTVSGSDCSGEGAARPDDA